MITRAQNDPDHRRRAEAAPATRAESTTTATLRPAHQEGNGSLLVETTAAILWELGQQWSLERIELDPPQDDEVLVEVQNAGMCHSNEHLVTGDLPFGLPIIGGHEGGGVVREVRRHVSWLARGDHVVFGFIPSCGRCPSCSTGHQSLCDLGAARGSGRQIADGTSRHHAQGHDLGLMCLVGSFAHHTVVNEASCIKIDPAIPLDRACLLGCSVVTGWGSAVYAADVRPGDVVTVVGVGGIGAAAIQGAKLSGARRIVAVDPVEWKREQALALGPHPWRPLSPPPWAWLQKRAMAACRIK